MPAGKAAFLANKAVLIAEHESIGRLNSVQVAGSGLFGSIKTWERLQNTSPILTFSDRQEIFCEGQSSEHYFKVISGVVLSCRFMRDGRRIITAFYVTGDVFGFDQTEQRSFSTVAVGNCTLMSHRRGAEALALMDRTILQQLFRDAMQELCHAQDHSLLLGRRGAAERIAAFLLDWSTRSPDKHVLDIAMSRQDIGDYLGLTIETVSRTLTQFERDGVIAMPNLRQICLNHPARLEALVI